MHIHVCMYLLYVWMYVSMHIYTVIAAYLLRYICKTITIYLPRCINEIYSYITLHI